jgi:adenine-specific DNA methylase
MAPCVTGGGLAWAVDSVLDAYEKLAALPRAKGASATQTTSGSASSLPSIENGSVAAVVVDPPYADNVQYAELADFFYVWLKRTQDHRRPEWFGTYLCDNAEEAVVNVSRHRRNGKISAAVARARAEQHYEQLMGDTFHECRRVLRDDGVLTVMFTHKRQEAWEALFQSLVSAGFTITATWPVQTESQLSLHQARKNAAQSTVVLVARKRQGGAGRGYFDDALQSEIREAARKTAARLRDEGLNPIDQLVGAFGPAMEVFSRYERVTTDTGEPVGVGEAIQAAANAVAEWRVEQLAQRGIESVDEESRFVLLCWDLLQAPEFRFNEAMLLGRSVRMDVDRLKRAGLLVSSSGSAKSDGRVKLLSAKDRRRQRPVRTERSSRRTAAAVVGRAVRYIRMTSTSPAPSTPATRWRCATKRPAAVRPASARSKASPTSRAGAPKARAPVSCRRW